MKAETQNEAKEEFITPPASESTTPDSDSVTTQQEASEGETLHSESATESTIQPESSEQGAKAKDEEASSRKSTDEKEVGSGSSSAQNLVGKINNLVTTDLGNIIEATDFLLILVYFPLHVGLSVYFLYNILGWR